MDTCTEVDSAFNHLESDNIPFNSLPAERMCVENDFGDYILKSRNSSRVSLDYFRESLQTMPLYFLLVINFPNMMMSKLTPVPWIALLN